MVYKPYVIWLLLISDFISHYSVFILCVPVTLTFLSLNLPIIGHLCLLSFSAWNSFPLDFARLFHFHKASTQFWFLKGLCWPPLLRQPLPFTTTKPYFIFYIVLRVFQITFIYFCVYCCFPCLPKCKPLKTGLYLFTHSVSTQNSAWCTVGSQMCANSLTYSLIS